MPVVDGGSERVRARADGWACNLNGAYVVNLIITTPLQPTKGQRRRSAEKRSSRCHETMQQSVHLAVSRLFFPVSDGAMRAVSGPARGSPSVVPLSWASPTPKGACVPEGLAAFIDRTITESVAIRF